MENLYFLQTVWYGLIGMLLLGYSILDGFDLGVGVMMPLLGKSRMEKKILLESIAPFWDGNEVWLLAGGGALFASFPHAYATVFSGFYLALMVVLFSLIFRAVSLEFIYHGEKGRKLWEWGLVIGSFLPSLLFGVALGNVIAGIPLDANMNYTGSFFTLLRPFPLAVGLLGLNAILLQGCTYLSSRTTGDLQQRARRATGKLWISFMVLFGLSFLLAGLFLPEALKKGTAWISALLVLLAWGLLKRSVDRARDSGSFIFSSIMFAGLWGIVGSVHFPYLVRASNDNSLSLTLVNASSSALTLKVMLAIAIIGMPLVVLYHFFVFKTFRGKIIK
jgi:cytochrome d ubiquinol oxidase subunit II